MLLLLAVLSVLSVLALALFVTEPLFEEPCHEVAWLAGLAPPAAEGQIQAADHDQRDDGHGDQGGAGGDHRRLEVALGSGGGPHRRLV